MKIATLIIIASTTLCTAQAQSKEELLGTALTQDTSKWERRGDHTLLKKTYQAFDKMQKAAKKDGVNLFIVSAYRSAGRQKGIWERKWRDPSRVSKSIKERALDILRYSSMPGTSRHHWGTDFDLCSVEPEYFERNAEGKKIYKWLRENAAQYGFSNHTPQVRTKGYAEERWHWGYHPLSEGYLTKYLETIKDTDLTGFAGCEVAVQIKMIENWVKL